MEISIFEFTGAEKPQSQPVQRNTQDNKGGASFEDVLGECAAVEGPREALGAKAEGCGGAQAPGNTDGVNKNAEAPDMEAAGAKCKEGARDAAQDHRADTGFIDGGAGPFMAGASSGGLFDPPKTATGGAPRTDDVSTEGGSGLLWAVPAFQDGMGVEVEGESGSEGADESEEDSDKDVRSVVYAYANALMGAIEQPAKAAGVIFVNGSKGANGPDALIGGTHLDGSFRQGTDIKAQYEAGTHGDVFNSGGVFAETAFKLMAADDGAALDPGMKTDRIVDGKTAEVPEAGSGSAGDGGETEEHFSPESIIEAALRDYGAGAKQGAADKKAVDAMPADTTLTGISKDGRTANVKSQEPMINTAEAGLSQDINPKGTPEADDAYAAGARTPFSSQETRAAETDFAPVKERANGKTEKVQRAQRAESAMTASFDADEADETVDGAGSAPKTVSPGADAANAGRSGDNFELHEGHSKKDTVAGDLRGAGAPSVSHAAQRTASAAEAQKASDERIKAGVYEKIEGGVRMSLSNSNKEVRISLSPDHLGSMSIRLKVDEGTVKADIVVENAAVKGILDGDAPRLKEIFSAHGLVLEKYTIEVNGQGGPSMGWEGMDFRGNGGLWESFREGAGGSRHPGESKGADPAPASDARYGSQAKGGRQKGVDLFI